MSNGKTNMRPWLRAGILAIFAMAALLSCATQASGPAPARSIAEVYEGTGRDSSLLLAMNAAKMDAVKKAVIAIIGAGAESVQRQQLEAVLYSSPNPNQFVYADSMETLRRENLGTIDNMDMIYEIRIRVNLPRIQQVLDSNGISANPSGQQAVAQGQNESAAANAAGATPGGAAAAVGETANADGGAAAPAGGQNSAAPSEQASAFMQNYLSNLSYMVYYSDQSSVDPFIMRTAVGQANSWLSNAGYRVVDPGQIEELQDDFQLVYEEQSGQELTMLQWIARRLNADVYIEIEASGSSRSENGRHFGQAILTVKMFETSTAQLLGSVPYTSPETFSRSSEEDALSNAVQSSVFQAMPFISEQSRIQLEQQLSNGIRYELVFLNTSDSRLMSRFRANLRDEVQDVITVHQSPGETRYDVYAFARNDELEEIIYRVSDRTPGMDRLSLVLSRGKTLTFDTGLLP